VLSRVVGSRLGRALVLGQTHGHPMRLSAEYARAAVTELGRCPGFEAALAGTAKRHFVATGPITAPVTVAFGSRDLLLRPGSRRLGQLPPHTRSATLPGCGHLPMADDPAAVAALITRTALSADQADQADQAVPQADRAAVA
jgi:pimeloyl-ACP methyl ester carboxylesterase